MDIPLGCHIGVTNVMTGGALGKSAGNSRVALKNPPSYNVSGGPIIINSHLNKFSSSPKPTDTPSGGFLASSKVAKAVREGKVRGERRGGNLKE